jgi:hypothetical protein
MSSDNDKPACGECSVALEPADVCQDEHGLLCLRCYDAAYGDAPPPVAPVRNVRKWTLDSLLAELQRELDRQGL